MFSPRAEEVRAKGDQIQQSADLNRTTEVEGYQSHLRRRKSIRAKRQISRMHEVQSSKIKQTIKRLAPYLSR